MLVFEELTLRLSQSQSPIENLKEALNIDALVDEVAVLEEEGMRSALIKAIDVCAK